MQTSQGAKVCLISDLLDAAAHTQDPVTAILLGQIISSHKGGETLDINEFSNGVTMLEKKLLQFVTGNSFLVGNRNLYEFTLSLKDYSKQQSQDQNDTTPNANSLEMLQNSYEEQLDDVTNLNIMSDLIRKSKQGFVTGNFKQITRREISATETILMNYNILQSENQQLRAQNQELIEYKLRYEKLQEDIQNNMINTTKDGKSVLQDFKNQNERQLKLIETLKNELERIKKENDIYKRINKGSKSSLNSNILQKLIEKSQQEYVNLKNVQLQKMGQPGDDQEMFQNLPDLNLQNQKSEVVLEESTSVGTLKNVFEGPDAQQKALQKNLDMVEEELQKSKSIVDQRIDETDSRLNQLNQLGQGDFSQHDEESKHENQESVSDRLAKLNQLNLNPIQRAFEEQLIHNNTRIFNSKQLLSPHQSYSQQDNLSDEELLVVIQGLDKPDHIPLRTVESIIMSADQHQVIAIHSFDRPDILLEVGIQRTEFVSMLITVFEQHELPRFKIYVSNSILIKEEFNFLDAKVQKQIYHTYLDEEVKDGEGGEDTDAKVSEELAPENYFEQLYRQSYMEVDKFQKQYEDLKNLMTKLDKPFTQKVVDNIYLRCVRVGLIMKKTQKMFKGWTEKFCVLTNAGMVYFNTHKKGDLDPRKFYPLNDFQIKDVEEKTAKKKFAFKIIFLRKEICKELLLAAHTQVEKDQWIIALKEHQRQFYDARIQIFNFKLDELKQQQLKQ
eukprot:403372219